MYYGKNIIARIITDVGAQRKRRQCMLIKYVHCVKLRKKY